MKRLRKSQKKLARANIRADIIKLEIKRGVNFDYVKKSAAHRAYARKSEYVGFIDAASGRYFSPLLSSKIEPDQKRVRSAFKTLIAIREEEALTGRIDRATAVSRLIADSANYQNGAES